MAVCKIKKFNPSYFSVYTILDSNTKTGTGAKTPVPPPPPPVPLSKKLVGIKKKLSIRKQVELRDVNVFQKKYQVGQGTYG